LSTHISSHTSITKLLNPTARSSKRSSRRKPTLIPPSVFKIPGQRNNTSVSLSPSQNGSNPKPHQHPSQHDVQSAGSQPPSFLSNLTNASSGPPAPSPPPSADPDPRLYRT